MARFDIPREHYLLVHWRDATVDAIQRYCRGHRVLDLGCGFGDYTREIKDGAMVLGIDISMPWLRHARSAVGIRCLARADAHRVPLRSRSCDAVVSVGLLEFVDPSVVIAEIARLLAPNGRCVLVSSNKYSAFRLALRALLAIVRRPYDRRETSLVEVLDGLRRNGMEIVEIKMDDGLIWLPDWLDRQIGPKVYAAVERVFRPFGRNPFSNEFMVVARRRGLPSTD